MAGRAAQGPCEEEGAGSPPPPAPRRARRQRPLHTLRPASSRARPQGVYRLCREAPRRRPRPPCEGPVEGKQYADAIRSGAAAPTARRQGAAAGGSGGGLCTSCGSDVPDENRPVCDRAARPGAYATAGAMTRGALPAAACAAPSPRSEACRAAAAASPWRRSASLPSARAPPGRGAMPRGARRAHVWIVESTPVEGRAVRAAHIVPTPARPSATWRRSGRRRFPWSNWRRATNWGLGRSQAAACIAFARLRPDQVEIRSNVPLMALSPS